VRGTPRYVVLTLAVAIAGFGQQRPVARLREYRGREFSVSH
jgi:hypothetical protein